jgi:ATP-dependent RNA helicase SUPV3L1/SUV3
VAAASAEGSSAGDQQQRRGDRAREHEGKARDRDQERRREKFAGERREKRADHDRGRDFGRDKGGRDKREGPSHRQYATSASPRDRDRAIDPNSPFAKLAALKEQLAANRKD